MGYPSAHKGYHCLYMSTHHVIISRHVVFDEFSFPFARDVSVPTSSFNFLRDDDLDIIVPCSTNNATTPSSIAPSSMDVELPHTSSGSGPVPPPGPLSGVSGADGRGSVPQIAPPLTSPLTGGNNTMAGAPLQASSPAIQQQPAAPHGRLLSSNSLFRCPTSFYYWSASY